MLSCTHLNTILTTAAIELQADDDTDVLKALYDAMIEGHMEQYLRWWRSQVEAKLQEAMTHHSDREAKDFAAVQRCIQQLLSALHSILEFRLQADAVDTHGGGGE